MAEVEEQESGSGVQGSVAADHRIPEPLRVLVAPTTADRFNTIAERLVPKGCFRLEDVLFEFDSSFVLPAVKAAMPALAELRERHKRDDVFPPLSIFGHGDPVGNDDYNKRLSGRRAQAIYAMLVRDAAMWEELFSKPAGGDDWGNSSILTMLDALGHTSESGKQADAVKSFQAEKGLKTDGVAGPKTRKALFLAYMDFLCGPDLVLDKEKDFLGQNKDPDGKADFQGCGEFNPIRMFSEEENRKFEKASGKTERNAENAPNRRVMILLFAPGRRVNPAVWPCPRAKEGVADCKKRFFPDAEKRRGFQEQRREFDKTKDTFACRFYQLISDDSPCERFLVTFSIRLYDVEGRFIPLAPFELSVGGKPPIIGKASGQGVAVAQDVEIPNQVSLKWGFPPPKDEAPALVFDLEMFLKPVEDDRDKEATQKLHNLGYAQDNPLEENVAGFQRDYGHLGSPALEETGELDDPTLELIRDVYRSCEDDLRNTQPQEKAKA